MCVCKMKQGRSGGYVRDGMSVEVMASSGDAYDDVLELASKTFHLKPSTNKILRLFTLSGAVIPPCEEWSLGSYLKRSHRNEVRIGIGYIEKVDLQLASYFLSDLV